MAVTVEKCRAVSATMIRSKIPKCCHLSQGKRHKLRPRPINQGRGIPEDGVSGQRLKGQDACVVIDPVEAFVFVHQQKEQGFGVHTHKLEPFPDFENTETLIYLYEY
jgi:hypothetical protein